MWCRKRHNTGIIFSWRRRSPQKAYFFIFAFSKLTFSLSTHRSFSLWSTRYLEEIRLRRPPFWNSLGSQAVCDVIPSDSKLAGRKKTCNWLCILHKVFKIYFVSQYIDYPLHYLQYLSIWSLDHIWLKTIWLNSSHNPEWCRQMW